MTETKTEVETRSGLTARAFIIATIGEILILTVGVANGHYIGLYFDGITITAENVWKYTHFYHWVGVTPLVCFSFVAVFALVMALLNRVAGRSLLSGQEMVVVATAWFFGLWFYDLYCNGFQNILTIPGSILGQPEEILPDLKASLPPILSPPISDDTWQRFLLTAYFVPDRITVPPWGALLPMSMWFAAMMSFWCFIFVFSVFLVRYVWFTVEYLTSPPADIISSLVDYSQPLVRQAGSGKSSIPFFENKYFFAPFIVCAIWTFLAYGLSNWNGVITWYTTGDGVLASQVANLNQGGIKIGEVGIQLWPNFDVTRLALVPWVGFMINLAPHWIAWGLLLPVRVLGNTVAGSIAVFIIWPAIMAAAGLWPEFAPGQGEGAAYGLRRDPPTGDSIYALYWGLLIGLAIYPLILNWRRIAPIFKGLYQKEPESFDREKPFAYRWIWIALIASSVVWIVLIYQLGPIPLPALITWLIMMVLMAMGSARMVAEAGGLWGWAFNRIYTSTPQFAGVFMDTQWFQVTGPQAGVPPSAAAVATSHLISNASLRGGIVGPGVHTAPLSAFTLRAGELQKTSRKSMFTIQIWGVLISFFVGVIIFWWQVGAVAVAAGPAGYAGGWNAVVGATYRLIWERASTGAHGYVNSMANPGPSYGLLIGGLLFAVAVPMLQARVPSLAFISVASIALAVFAGDHIWVPFLVALIIKFIAIRVGGFALYNDKIRPIALGIFAGVMLGVFINALGQSWLSWIGGRMY